jgi:hypothetical protein
MRYFLMSVGLLTVGAGCVKQEPVADTQAPPDQPFNFTIKPTTMCETADVGSTLTMTHPLTGKPLTVQYKSSDDVDYSTKGWESRIPMTKDFFGAKNLGGYDSSEFKITVIDVRNVNGKPHYHYFSNGTQEQTMQNWSSTKFMGASFGIHNVREQSGGATGADIKLNGRVLASDLDIVGNVSDNNYAGSIKWLGGHKHADMMLENWMRGGKRADVDGSAGLDTFGGAWGPISEPCGGNLPPSSVVDNVTGKSVPLSVDSNRISSGNHISGLSFTEWMKRMAVNERDNNTMPKLWNYMKGAPTASQIRGLSNSLTKRDLEILFYGTAAYSDKEFTARGLSKGDCGGTLGGNYSQSGGKPRGGMMWDGMRDWPQNAGGSANLTKLFGDRWRTLGKGGSGGTDEAAIGWMCFPKTANFAGRELIVYVHYRSNKGRSLPKYSHMHKASAAMFDVMVPGLRSGAPKEMGKFSGGSSIVTPTPIPTALPTVVPTVAADVSGTAVLSVDTYLKTSNQQFSVIKDDPSQFCLVKAGTILNYTSRVDGGSGHQKLTLDGVPAGCGLPFKNTYLYLFSSHATFSNNP